MRRDEIRWMSQEESWVNTKFLKYREFLMGLPLSIETLGCTPSPETVEKYIERLKLDYEESFKKDGSFLLEWNKVNNHGE